MTVVFLLALAMLPGARPSPTAQQAAFLAEVQTAWVGRMALLRGFPTANGLRYGPDGQLLQAEASGPWTLAEMQVNKIAWRGGELQVSGERDGLLLKNRAYVPVDVHQKIRLAIQLGADPLDAATVQKLTQAIFVPAGAVAKVVPSYWQGFITGKTPASARPMLVHGMAARIVHPSVLFSPAPRYTPEARHARLEGTVVLSIVVGTDGRAHDIQIAQPLGLGLDDAAVHALRNWRFRPATSDGQPLSVRADIQVHFRMF